jgi:adenylate cyclase
MKGPHRRWVLVCGLVPTLFVAVLSLVRPSVLARTEFDVYDTLFWAAPRAPLSQRVVIVDVDERSLTAIGQWPWRRDVIASLVDRLRTLGAASIGVDMIFAEPDREAGGVHDPDGVLAKSVRKGGVVLGYAMRFDDTRDGSSPCVRHPLSVAVVTRGAAHTDYPALFRATGAVCSLPLLNEAAFTSGFLNAAPDPDGILRRVPVLMEINGTTHPSLALASVASMAHVNRFVLKVIHSNASTLTLGDRLVPLDGQGNLLVHYRGKKRTFEHLSAVDVVQGRVGAKDVRNRIVLVGATALGLREVVATPLDTLFAGVEVQATVADNLLQGDFLGRPQHATAIETAAAIVLGHLAALQVRRRGLAWGTLGMAMVTAGVWAAAAHALAAYGTVLSPFYPTLGVSSALAGMTLAGLTLERRRADAASADRATTQRLMVRTLLSLTGIRDAETGRHSSRTERYARLLATELSKDPAYAAYLTPQRIELLASLAPLHDIGKVGVPDAVLNKPGDLTPDELAEMRRHPEYGRDVIMKAERDAGVRDDAILSLAKEIVYTHHEKWDGTGYPQGLRGTEIPIPGRVMAVVDVYDALRTRRLYDKPLSAADTRAFIAKRRGTHFDPAVVDAFERIADVMHDLSKAA